MKKIRYMTAIMHEGIFYAEEISYHETKTQAVDAMNFWAKEMKEQDVKCTVSIFKLEEIDYKII